MCTPASQTDFSYFILPITKTCPKREPQHVYCSTLAGLNAPVCPHYHHTEQV